MVGERCFIAVLLVCSFDAKARWYAFPVHLHYLVDSSKKYRKMSSNEQITPLNVTVPLYPFYGKAMSMP
jgi:hypothetical protein